MKPVSDLDDVEELEHEVHVDVRIALPEQADVEEVLPEEDVARPQDRHQVEAEQLTAVVELGVLDLGKVQLAVDLVKEVLLHDLMHDDGDQQVEESGGDVLVEQKKMGFISHPYFLKENLLLHLDSRCVESDVDHLPWHDLNREGGVVVKGDEHRSHRGSHLEKKNSMIVVVRAIKGIFSSPGT